MKASWNGVVIAQSDDTVLVEGNHYFPLASLDRSLVTFSNHKTMCPWKGQATYMSLIVNGDMHPDAAWTYADPKPKGGDDPQPGGVLERRQGRALTGSGFTPPFASPAHVGEMLTQQGHAVLSPQGVCELAACTEGRSSSCWCRAGMTFRQTNT